MGWFAKPCRAGHRRSVSKRPHSKPSFAKLDVLSRASPPPSSPANPMAMKALTAVILGAFALSGSCGKSTENPTKEPGPGPDAPVVVLEGIDTAPLTQREKKEWSGYVSELISPCPNVPVP